MGDTKHSEAAPGGGVEPAADRTISEASGTPEPGRGGDDATVLGPGQMVQRFVVHRVVGSGGAGVVYAAYDPELDRKVALKLLRPEVSRRAGAGSRFLREAQALARLSHPNVIAVYDVGQSGDRAFLAMEYIEGDTLRGWMSAKRRSWREALALISKAGRGLAAAHAAGLIHRDFKPENVLVGGDGRVVVTDFGLARAASDPELDGASGDGPAESAGDHRSSRQLTRTGAALGTPAYMAPEQSRGETVDARADQFSFCVTLYEALFDRHPFADGTAVSMSPAQPPPRGSRVPSWLARAALRGLAVSREGRHPSMDALLAALERAPRRRRRVALALGAAVAVVGAAAIGSMVARDRGQSTCGGAERKLAGVWDEEIKSTVQTAFSASALPYAAEAWKRTAPVVDAYAASWTAAHTEACRATRVHREQSEEIMDRRMACLDARRLEFVELTGLLRRPDARVIEHAAAAANALSRVDDCADLETLTRAAPPPADPVARARVAELREQLAEAKLLGDTGKYREGLAVAGRLVDGARAVDDLPIRADALHQLGFLQATTGSLEEAVRTLADATWAAEASRQDGLAARALINLLNANSLLGRFDQANEISRRADAAILRARDPGPLRADFLSAMGQRFHAQGDYRRALSSFEEALTVQRKVKGADHLDVAPAFNDMGAVLKRLGRDDEAMVHFGAALQIREKALGPRHPEVAASLNNVALILKNQHKYDEALAHFQRALVIRQETVGPDNPQVATVLDNIANVWKRQGKHDEAIAYFRRALAIYERGPGAGTLGAARSHLNLGNVYLEQKKYDAALAQYERSAELFETGAGRDHDDFAAALINICSLHATTKKYRAALSYCRRALTIYERSFGADHPQVAWLLSNIADVEAAAGLRRDAVASLERALAIRESSGSKPGDVAAVRFALAKLHWTRDRKRARALASAAHDRLVGAGEPHAALRDEIAAWLRTHGGSRRR